MPEAMANGRLLDWRTSTRSIGGGECVEVSAEEGRVFLRDSRDRGGAVITYSAGAWHKFIIRSKHQKG
jgi:hypothetical protein